jgi:hypothetical protein
MRGTLQEDAAQAKAAATQPVFANEYGHGVPEQRPENSVYYHPTLNPAGVPPPGKPQRYRTDALLLLPAGRAPPLPVPAAPPLPAGPAPGARTPALLGLSTSCTCTLALHATVACSWRTESAGPLMHAAMLAGGAPSSAPLPPPPGPPPGVLPPPPGPPPGMLPPPAGPPPSQRAHPC